MRTATTLRNLSWIVLCLSSVCLKAQNWEGFSPVLSQMDSSMRDRYHTNLEVLQNTWKPSSYNFSAALDSLDGAVNGLDPASGLGDLLPIWTPAQDSLNGIIGMSGLVPADSLAVLTEFDTLSGIFDLNQDSLLQVFSVYQDVLTTPNLPTHYTAQPNVWQPTVDSLTQNQANSFFFSPTEDPGKLHEAIKQLFDPHLFTRLEMFGGRQTVKAGYYGTGYVVHAPVIGLRSVEQFDRTWETRWRVQGSWLNEQPGTVTTDPGTTPKKGFVPLLFHGNFDVMYIPQIGTIGGNALHLITVLGMEAGTYAPAHRNPAIPASLQNKGYSTGWGPSLGAGMSIKVGSTTIYAMGTTAYGDVVCGPNFASDIPYRYRSTRVEAGIMYANLVTLRFESALSINWANNGNKNVRYQQLTVGLPTKALFH